MVPPQGARPPDVDFASDTLYSSAEYNSEQYTALSGEFLAANPGSYALNLTNTATHPVLFILQVGRPGSGGDGALGPGRQAAVAGGASEGAW